MKAITSCDGFFNLDFFSTFKITKSNPKVMKQLFFKLSLILFSLLFILSCKKKDTSDPATKPVPVSISYTYSSDLQSSKDISFATYAISDIDLMCALWGDGSFYLDFYSSVPSITSGGTVTCIRDPISKLLNITFNNTTCLDGKLRDGSLFMDYSYVSGPNPSANYYRDFGFAARLILSNYKVNGWLIEIYDPNKPATIKNTLSTTSFDPTKTNLTWELAGKFKLTNLSDSSKTIIWDGTLIKTLTNTSDTSVYKTSSSYAIGWKFARISYKGTVTGMTGVTVPFTYVIDNSNPIVRDFNCSLSVPTIPGSNKFHPFISGDALFTTSNYDPRTINYGPAQACDNSGTISFHGETHIVDFD
jgi:hypothetical protein